MKLRPFACLSALVFVPGLVGAQTIGTTTVMAPLAGRLSTPASGQTNIGFYGTDLGYTFKHGTSIRVLFGDTWANNAAAPIGPTADDALGTISLAAFPDGDAVDSYVSTHPPGAGKLSWQAAAPPVTFRLNFFGKVAPMPVYRGGTAGTLLAMGTLRVPVAGFSNARSGSSGAAFALFHRSVATECSGATHTCPNSFTCDTGMGTCVGHTGENDLPCLLGTTRCTCVAVSGGGMCQDRTSSVYDGTEDGRVLSIAFRQEVGNADPTLFEQHYTQSWYTNKFINPAVKTVNDFDPNRANGTGNDYHPADGVAPTTNEKIFVWGRPNFAGLGSQDRDLQLYFAYFDMPVYNAQGNFAWTPHYFTGLAGNVPQFSSSQANALPLDLSGGSNNPAEVYDMVNMMTVAFVPALSKWVMLYGGDLPASVLSFLLGPNYTQAVRDPDGAIHARFADQPWGPWTAPVQVFRAGDPNVSPPVAGTPYASGGILHHPGCTTDCAPGEPSLSSSEVGRLYGANIVDTWTMNRSGGAVDLYWNVSTWNPYETVLLKTRIGP